jgi:hypothetical protein
MTPTSSFKWKDWEAIDIALEAGLSGVVLNFPISKQLVNHFLPGWNMDQVLQKSVGMAGCAAEKDCSSTFSLRYHQGGADFVERIMKAAVKEARGYDEHH